MSNSDNRRRRELLVLDTGPILELILYRAAYALGFSRLRSELRYLVNLDTYQKCSQFLASFRKKITSASVVAELYRWIRNTERSGHARLWELTYEEFRNMSMDESVVKLLEMQIELVVACGPTDASLIEIARRGLREGPVVLTLDSKLHAECRKAQIGSELLIEICNR